MIIWQHSLKTDEYECLKKLFLQTDLADENDEKLLRIEETFQEAIGKRIDNVENVPTDKKSYLVKVEADGEIYYLKITSKYFLSEIRADKEDGEVLYQVVY